MLRPKRPVSPFRYFNSSPKIIWLVVMMYVCFPLSLRNLEDLLAERGIDICPETVRHWWNRFGPLFAADVRHQRVNRMKGSRQWKWHLDEVYVKINGEMHYLWQAVDQEGELLESYVTKRRDKQAALAFMKKALKRHGSPETITTDDLIGTGKWQINPVAGAVYAFDQQTFAFAGYKHYFSIAGDDQREDINRSEGRALFARLFTNATWVLGDIKYSKSHTGLEAETLDLEGEYGTMLSRSVALSGRVGTSCLDSQRQFGLSLNLRKFF